MNGMDDGENDHEFSDNDFDVLPDSTLNQLEQNAIQSTQQQPRRTANVSAAGGFRPLAPNARKFPLQSRRLLPSGPSTTLYHNQFRPREPGAGFDPPTQEDSDYEHDGASTPVEERESFILHKVPSEMTQREQWRQQRFGKAATHGRRDPTHSTVQLGAPSVSRPVPRATGQVARQHPDDRTVSPEVELQRPVAQIGNPDEKNLKAQLEQILHERDQLADRLKEANTTVYTQRGEIAIIRENQKKEAKTFDRQLEALKKAAQDEVSRHKAAFNSLHEESKKLATQNKFLQHELDQEADKANSMQRTRKERPVVEKANLQAASPSSKAAHSLRDGFDDGELMILSPSKSGRRSKPGTPTAGHKRKRKVDLQSPVPPLVLRQSSASGPNLAEPPKAVPKAERSPPRVQNDGSAANNLQFLQRIFNHRLKGEREHLIESFVKFALPSDPHRTFTTIIIESTAGFPGPQLPQKILKVLTDIWAKALKEKYYGSIGALLDAVEFVINLEPSVVDGEGIINLLPVLQGSAKINATIRFNHSPVSQASFGKFKQTPKSELNAEVDEFACLEALYNVASICLMDRKKINLFWRSMEMDFVLLMLNSTQPIPQITLVLLLLSTSILSHSFAMISDDEEEQSKLEGYVIDRVCWLLWETPRVDEGLPPPSQTELCNFRLEAMALLHALAFSSPTYPPPPRNQVHGSVILTRHRHAIARLVRSIYDEVALLYTSPPPQLRNLRITLIDKGMALLHHLLTGPHTNTANGGLVDVDVQSKLQAINGCVHRYRVVLTRLAFSEDSIWHDSIQEATVSRAFELLEEVVTPEEAEMLVAAFPGWNGRKNNNNASRDGTKNGQVVRDGDGDMDPDEG